VSHVTCCKYTHPAQQRFTRCTSGDLSHSSVVDSNMLREPCPLVQAMLLRAARCNNLLCVLRCAVLCCVVLCCVLSEEVSKARLNRLRGLDNHERIDEELYADFETSDAKNVRRNGKSRARSGYLLD